jgi:hypothetical protein
MGCNSLSFDIRNFEGFLPATNPCDGMGTSVLLLPVLSSLLVQLVRQPRQWQCMTPPPRHRGRTGSLVP